ncbi:succinate dehydrogenase assembly factor 4, mitochondrial isoform X2 [Rhea pennata]|uniref:succinate dehydrogenase assembly factor 4, mitochondrial isoform X2 n=1 Tax=Rhea pennata TaxID=8795 RepID=UPI002E264DEF
MALRLLRVAPRAARSSLLCSSLGSSNSNAEGRSEPVKQSLKKPKLPVGRFDEPEESNIEREPLERFLLSFLIFNSALHCCFPPLLRIS